MKSTRIPWISVAALYCLSLTASASLILHWKLDETDGDYTTGGYNEQVHTTTLSAEVSTGTDITEGQTGMAPGGGSSMSFSDTATDSYIAAGSVESTGGVGTHIVGTATVPLVLGNNFTMSAWFNTDVINNTDRTISSNTFNSNTGFLFGIRGTSLIMDFGNTRHATATGVITTGQTYFMAVMQDPNGDANYGWAAGANNRIALYNPTTLTWQYFDGIQLKSGLNLQNMRIGAFVGGGREFDGLLDDVRVYNNTLSQEQLNAMVVDPAGPLTLLAPVATVTGATTADVSVYPSKATDGMVVYWGTADQGETATGWTGTPIVLGPQSAATVSTNLTGLTPNTLYYVRFNASITSPAEEEWSPAATFVSGLSNGVAGPTLSAGTVTGVDVPLSWDDSYLAETGFVLERADDNAFTTNVATFTISANGIAYTDRSGASATTYYYRVAAKDAIGQSAYSNTVMVTTGTVAAPVPLLHWKLDDAGTTFEEEATGQTTTAVAVNTVTTGQAALAPGGGSSVSLGIDTPASYIDAGTLKSDNTYVAGSDAAYKLLNDAWTVTGWAKITNTGLGDQIIVSSDWNSSDGWMIGTADDDMLFDYGNSRLKFGTNQLVDGQTYLFVARRDATKTVFGGGVNSAAISFWDGSAWTELQSTATRNIRLQGLEIGSFGTGTRQLGGNIDDVRIYDRALTQAELEALTASGSTSPFDGWATSGTVTGVTFDGDANSDGVQDGLAFLLGATTPDVDAKSLLPTPAEDGSGGLQMSFTMLKPTPSTPAVLSLGHSGDLGIGDPWASVAVPAATGSAGGVNFTVSDNVGDPTNKNDVVATIPATENAIDGKLFGRLRGDE